jgi:hypothetical protein
MGGNSIMEGVEIGNEIWVWAGRVWIVDDVIHGFHGFKLTSRQGAKTRKINHPDKTHRDPDIQNRDSKKVSFASLGRLHRYSQNGSDAKTQGAEKIFHHEEREENFDAIITRSDNY